MVHVYLAMLAVLRGQDVFSFLTRGLHIILYSQEELK